MVNKNQSMIPYIHLELLTKYENKKVEKLQSTTLDCGIPRTQLFKENSYTHMHRNRRDFRGSAQTETIYSDWGGKHANICQPGP